MPVFVAMCMCGCVHVCACVSIHVYICAENGSKAVWGQVRASENQSSLSKVIFSKYG